MSPTQRSTPGQSCAAVHDISWSGARDLSTSKPCRLPLGKRFRVATARTLSLPEIRRASRAISSSLKSRLHVQTTVTASSAPPDDHSSLPARSPQTKDTRFDLVLFQATHGDGMARGRQLDAESAAAVKLDDGLHDRPTRPAAEIGKHVPTGELEPATELAEALGSDLSILVRACAADQTDRGVLCIRRDKALASCGVNRLESHELGSARLPPDLHPSAARLPPTPQPIALHRRDGQQDERATRMRVRTHGSLTHGRCGPAGRPENGDRQHDTEAYRFAIGTRREFSFC